MKAIVTKREDLGNGESMVCGISEETNGTFTAVTFCRSRNFKTMKGAVAWLERNGGYDNEED